MSSNEEQVTVDHRGPMLLNLLSNEHPPTVNTDAEGWSSNMAKRQLTLRPAVTRSEHVRKGYRAFCIGLYFGISLATFLSLVVIYVELNQVKAELGVVQQQLKLYRRRQGAELRDANDWQEGAAEVGLVDSNTVHVVCNSLFIFRL